MFRAAIIPNMPKSKTAEAAAAEKPVKAAEATKRTSKTTTAGTKAAAATHKSTSTKKAKATSGAPAVNLFAAEETAIPVSATPAPSAAAPVKVVTHEEIAVLAYSYWEKRGYNGGCPQEDWFRAETALRG